jgi:hypothetical protein
MNPNDMQDVLEMQRQAATLARHSEFLGCSQHVAILFCAVFSILIFWRLCQFKKLLESHPQKPSPVSTAPKPAALSRQDDSPSMPELKGSYEMR